MWRIYKDWGLWLAFILAFGCYLIASDAQIGLTFDSYHYLAAAESWAKNRQLIDHQGNIYANWPPLYPLLLSLGAPSILYFAIWLHGFALLASIYFFARCLPDKLSVTVRNAALLSYALYAPLLASSIYLWSEVIFMALLMAAFATFLRKEKPAMLALYIILANLMCLQRNAGIFFVAAWTFAQFLTAKNAAGLSRRTGLIALEGGLAAVAFIVWQLRNFLWVKDAQDFRQNIALIDLAESFRLSLSAMSTWILPLQFPETFRVAIFLSIMAALIFLTVRNNAQQRLNATLLLTFACYLVGMWMLRMNLPSENDRYFLPLFPFFLLLVVAIIEQIRTKKLALLILFTLMSYHIARGIKNTCMWHNAGKGLSLYIPHH